MESPIRNVDATKEQTIMRSENVLFMLNEKS